uniref:B1 protein-like n=1 Tax=Diabrotica virgifera virgifera TaxID=50390 RepID=A0A6P7FHQ1_DIAVI
MWIFQYILCVFFFVYLPISVKASERVETHRQCQANTKTKLSDDIVHKLHTGEEVNDPILGKHMLCMFTKMLIMNADGDINAEVLRTKANRALKDENKLNALVKRCSIKEPGSAEDAAIKLLKCVEIDVPVIKHQYT